jgi:hypothetical protein
MKKKESAMVRNNHRELGKCTIVSWVYKSLDQTLSKKNIKSEFKIIKIWPFNPKAMDGKTRPFKVYTLDVTNILDGDNDDFDGLDNEQKEPKEDGATTQLLNLIAIIKEVRIDYHK